MVAAGDDGSCGCDAYCASNWNNEVKNSRPNWKGAAAVPGHNCSGLDGDSRAFTPCFCVQATHWCAPQNTTVGAPACSASCDKTGVPKPHDYCIPA